MRARSRNLNEVVGDVMKVIDPSGKETGGHEESWRADLARTIERLRRVKRHHLRKAELRTSLDELETALRKARGAVARWAAFSPFSVDDFEDLLDRLDERLNWIERRVRPWAQHVFANAVEKRAPLPDLDAKAAVSAAHAFVLRCPWLKPSVYDKGAWHRVAVLFYEGITGKRDATHLMKYVREWKPEEEGYEIPYSV
jgi:hypothetical protein